MKYSSSISVKYLRKGAKIYYEKNRAFLFAIVLPVVIVLFWVKSLLFIMENRDEIVFTCLLHSHVEYNGNAYYMAEDQHESFLHTGTDKRGPVYLIYKSSKINYEPCNFAFVYTGYEGEEEEIYIFFDSAIYIREDYRHIEDNL